MEKELYFLRSSEQYLAKELLHYAARLDETKDTLENHPYLEQYEQHFGSLNGDIGVYMIADKKVAGGAWVRLLAKGLGFVEENTPELVLAVKPSFRNKGLATEIMNQLFIEVAKSFSTISLSAIEGDTVSEFYKGLGFEKVEGSEHLNSAGSTSFLMLKSLDKPEELKEEKHLEEEFFRKSVRAPN